MLVSVHHVFDVMAPDMTSDVRSTYARARGAKGELFLYGSNPLKWMFIGNYCMVRLWE